MPDEHHNELNDIILNRSARDGTRKKMLIGVGTLVVVAIVIIVIMGRMSGSSPVQVAHPEVVSQPVEEPVTPPESVNATAETAEVPEPATLPAAVNEPAAAPDVANPVPIEQSDIIVIDETEPEVAPQPKPAPAPVATPKPTPTPTPTVAGHPAPGDIYIQVGSFSRYKPNRTFLDNIKRSGFEYTFHRVVINGAAVNKVLVGPFKSRSDAKARLQDVRRKIESGAFIYTIKP
ncbi:SPOR domain-containing protein [Sulfurimonas sp. HSL-3221]|uniref:SPOR domain-containing protein n=1 Tax=Sulfurimonadaceae TaxID=2771471 RepID=UPI001E41C1C4|nr:SPOR domain-containing protein [Sulfurimonas sp. HSL-3221]UFS61407.1 SPOR domain-containing protein [Sulfurimonas sp. HSL-3221]